MSMLLCFSGQIGSGKSAISALVAERLGWRHTGFGDYLRSEIRHIGGDPSDRKALQDLGEKRVHEDPQAFCCDVLSVGGFLPGEDFVVDGVRHVQIFDCLATMSTPSQARLIFLEAGEATRVKRVGARSDAGDFVRASTHKVEAELNIALPDRADGIVSAEQPIDRVVADCLNLVQHWQAHV